MDNVHIDDAPGHLLASDCSGGNYCSSVAAGILDLADGVNS